jgi:hypothetical protein
MKVTIEFHLEDPLEGWVDKELTVEDINRVIRRQLPGWDNTIQASVVVDKVYGLELKAEP